MKKIKLYTNIEKTRDQDNPHEEVEQRLTITANGHVTFNSSVYDIMAAIVRDVKKKLISRKRLSKRSLITSKLFLPISLITIFYQAMACGNFP